MMATTMGIFFAVLVLFFVCYKVWEGYSESTGSYQDEEPRKINLEPPRIRKVERPQPAEVTAVDQTNVFSAPSLPAPPPLPVREEVIISEEEDLVSVATDAPEEATAPVEPQPEETTEASEIEEPKLVQPDNLRIAPEADTRDLYDAARELFLAPSGHYAATKVFADQFDGERISGGGKLVRVDRFTNDLVFGRGPGAMATVEVEVVSDEDENQRTTRQTVKVIVCLPQDELDEMKSLIGQTVAVGGTAVKCDVFAEKLFLSGI